MTKVVMVQGTHSDAGKSLIATALCRIFARKGYKTAPFKSQNMSLNSYVTLAGAEIGVAQGVQAEAARTIATEHMNPILIKPSGDMQSQIVVHGKPVGTKNARQYREQFYESCKQAIYTSYTQLHDEYDCLVIEGAGSPAEINLNDRELVNMRIARLTNAPVVLVGDIDKGGVFASLVGTLQLLSEADRARVIGVIINKFRGDVSLLQSGLDWFEQYTGKKVLGVVPYVAGLSIEAEDSVSLQQLRVQRDETKSIDIAVLRLPHIANFTDLDPLLAEEDCSVRLVSRVDQLGVPDLLIIPGTKNTIEDYVALRESGLVEAVKALVGRTTIFGICGGYQMLGREIADPLAVETTLQQCEAFHFFPFSTVMAAEKTTMQTSGTLQWAGGEFAVTGYEIHMGQTVHSYAPLIHTSSGVDGIADEKRSIYGTYFHGIFHNDAFRTALLNRWRRIPQQATYYLNEREQSMERLADAVEAAIDVPFVLDEMERYEAMKRPVMWHE